MTPRKNPARALLALLEQDESLETMPVEEVRADLAALGIESAPANAVVRSMAARRESPAARLLDALEEAEDLEHEISRLEAADIETIRGQVEPGSAAAVAAAARRKAGIDSNVVGIPRRSRLQRWSRPLAGVAASLLVVAVSLSVLLRQGDWPFSAVQETMQAAEKPYADAETFSLMDERSSTSAPAPPAAPSLALPEVPAQAEAEGFAKSREQAATSTQSAGDAPARRSRELQGVLDSEPQTAVPPSGVIPEQDTALTRDYGFEAASAPRITAIFVVDPAQAPTALQTQGLAPSDLANRIDEARRLAGDRPIVTLFSVESGQVRQDYAQVPLAPHMTQQLAAPSPMTSLLGPEAARYDFIALPPR